MGILTVLVFALDQVKKRFAEGTKAAVAGSLLASMNTASEYGFGGVTAALPGFLVIAEALRTIPNPLANVAISVSVLAGITGSASGGMSIALPAMADQFIAAAKAADIPLEVLHRVASMASGMDTLPHNGSDHSAFGYRPHAPAVVRRHFRDHVHQDTGGLPDHRRLLCDRSCLRLGTEREGEGGCSR
jgi:H+/gluconate symporter-like permease